MGGQAERNLKPHPRSTPNPKYGELQLTYVDLLDFDLLHLLDVLDFDVVHVNLPHLRPSLRRTVVSFDLPVFDLSAIRP